MLRDAAPDDDLTMAAAEGSISAGEGGDAADVSSADSRNDAEVIIGKIPDPNDLSVMLWTARCSDPDHDLLGHFDSEKGACEAKGSHLASEHGSGTARRS